MNLTLTTYSTLCFARLFPDRLRQFFKTYKVEYKSCSRITNTMKIPLDLYALCLIIPYNKELEEQRTLHYHLMR